MMPVTEASCQTTDSGAGFDLAQAPAALDAALEDAPEGEALEEEGAGGDGDDLEGGDGEDMIEVEVRAVSVDSPNFRKKLDNTIDSLHKTEAAKLYVDDRNGYVCIRGPVDSAARSQKVIEALIAGGHGNRPSPHDARLSQANPFPSLPCAPPSVRAPDSPMATLPAPPLMELPLGVGALSSPQAEPPSKAGEVLLEQRTKQVNSMNNLNNSLAVMEIDVPKQAVGKVIGTRGAVIRSLRDQTRAEIKLDKQESGDGILFITGSPKQLQTCAEMVRKIVESERSVPYPKMSEVSRAQPPQAVEQRSASSIAMREGEELGVEYVMPLPPHEANVLDGSKELSDVMRLASVRMQVTKSEDGWMKLLIRGSSAAINNAKRRIEAIVHNKAEENAEKLRPGPALEQPPLIPHGEVGSHVPELLIRKEDDGILCVEIELTNKDQVGAVIGEGGRTINSIRASTGADIQVETFEGDGSFSTQRKVVIKAEESACMSARGLVYDVLRSNTGKRDYSQNINADDGSTVMRLMVPRHLIGRVIGKRGQTIKELRERTGAVIELAKEQGSGVGTVTLSGSLECVHNAKAVISELVEEDLPLEVQQTLSRMLNEVVVLSVPANRVGKVIGSRGAIIQGLRQESGAQIDLQKDPLGTATVTLRGSIEQMDKAKLAIERIVEAGQL